MAPEERREKRTNARIVINGREYRSMEDVPEQYRDLLRDSDGDGVPDVLQGATGQRMRVARIVRDERETYTYNGREFERIEELPPEARRFLERQTAPGAGEAEAAPSHPVQPAAQRPEPPGQEVPPMPGARGSRLVVLIAAVLAAALVVALFGWMMGWF